MMGELGIVEAREEDLDQAADLIVRMKRLNGEFDPLFKAVEDAKERALSYLGRSTGAEGHLVLVAKKGSKVLGVLRAEVRERLFYEPSREGDITDFYILPEWRRRALGDEMLQRASERLKEMGAEVIVAEFPARNEIGSKFYTKRGFRPLVNTFAIEEQRGR
ncbi:MAG: GNAT family N-acetyltransferase [Nitrososphaerales archaeon]|jgi:ribosomal protein S18 acetylase RimI-like enzyme